MDQSYVMFRYPDESKPHLWIQQSPIEQLYNWNLNKLEGYIFAPFAITEKTPILCINPEVKYEGFQAINKAYIQHKLIEYPYKNNTQQTTFESYKKAFDTSVKQLNSNLLSKIVLSRTLSIPSKINPLKAFENACDLYPNQYIALISSPISGTWLTITPEILFEANHKKCCTVALAGTIPLTQTIWSNKNVKEQEIVLHYLSELLSSNVSDLHIGNKTFISAGNLQHQSTPIEFTLPTNQSLGEIIALLHPTPAVCGYPKDLALDCIENVEQHPRRYYAGFSGIFNVCNQTKLYVTLRCMEWVKNGLLLYAGGGIMPNSQLDSEWEETILKLNTCQRVISNLIKR